jgi:hypothetical protein
VRRQLGQNAKRLCIALESVQLILDALLVEFLLPDVAEGRMTKVVREAGRLRCGHVDVAKGCSSFCLRRVTVKVLGKTAGKLLHLQGVGESRVKEGSLAHGDNLRDTAEPAKFIGIQNPVAVVFGCGSHVLCGHYICLSRSTGLLAGPRSVQRGGAKMPLILREAAV